MKGILKWSITTKLTLSYLIITAFVAVMGYLEYSALQKVEERGQEMHDKHLRGLANLTRIAESYPSTLSHLRDLLLADSTVEREMARNLVLRERDNIREWTKMLRTKLVNEEERRVFTQYEEALRGFEQQRSLFMEYTARQEEEKAKKLLYGTLQERAEDLQIRIDQLISLKTEDASAARAENETAAQETVFRLSGMVLTIVLFTIFIAFFVYYHISIPIKSLENKAHVLAMGSTELPHAGLSRRRDELGAMTRSFNEVVEGLRDLVEQSKRIAAGDYGVQVNVRSKKDALGIALNEMTQSLKAQNWRKDGSNRLNTLLSGHQTLQEISSNTISFLGEFMEAGAGVIYIWDEKDEVLKLFNSYAYTEREHDRNRFKLGEGVVGQAALERKPILLRQVGDNGLEVTSGTVSRKPLNIIAFPLIYEDELCGVIELASFQAYGELEQQFIEEVSENIASHIYSAQQSERIQGLLTEAEKAKREANEQADKALKANKKLKEQQAVLEQQTRDLQQQSEELQQQAEEMQQQSEELQQTNDTLEEQREALEEQARELKQASQYKSEFLANMSHELRTPLNSIILLSDMLRRNNKGNLSEKESQKADIIYHSGNDLLNLINDILDISKIEAGRMTVNIHHFQTRELVEELQGLFGEVANQKGLYFKVEDEHNAELINDKDKIKQVLKNFLSNAFKFTKQGGVTLRIAKNEDEALPLRLSVIDTGVGIPKEKQDVIFEAFQQADGSVSREFGGTGLGLSIAREMSRLLGGEVGLESDTGQGSEFYLLLPVKNNAIETGKLGEDVEVNYQKPSGKQQQLQSGGGQNGSQQKQEKVASAEAKVRDKVPSYRPQVGRLSVNDDRSEIHEDDRYILIVEDNVDYANSLAEIVRDAGFKALITIQGKDALSLVEEYEPAGVLLDLGLPDMSGENILTHLKTNKHLQHIPVCIVSARDLDMSLLEKGAIDYLQKPIAAEEVRQIVERLVGITDKATKHLLLVSDQASQVQQIADVVSKEGIEVYSVDKISDAERELSREAYDALIVDIAVEGRGGMALCRHVNESGYKIPVIIYTDEDLTREEKKELQLYTVSIIIKGDESEYKLIEKVQLFLHQMQEEKAKKVASAPEKETPPPSAAPTQAEEEEIDRPSTEQIINIDLEQLLSDDTDGENEKTKTSSTGSLEDVRILVVDDDVRNVFVLTSALENHDAIMYEAFNGQEALEVLEQETVDLVLMDIMMPILDGYETMRLIRLNEDFKDLPIIAVTAKVQKEDREKCFEAGANAYISKPIDYQELMRVIQESLTPAKEEK